jgi:hypothetical protein
VFIFESSRWDFRFSWRRLWSWDVAPFNPDDGGSKFFQNFSQFLRRYSCATSQKTVFCVFSALHPFKVLKPGRRFGTLHVSYRLLTPIWRGTVVIVRFIPDQSRFVALCLRHIHLLHFVLLCLLVARWRIRCNAWWICARCCCLLSTAVQSNE